MFAQIFYTNVLKLLKQKKLSKKDLSDLTGISTAYLTMLTKGQTNPTLAIMEKIALGLDVSLPFLLVNNDLPEDETAILNLSKPSVSGFVFVHVNTYLPSAVAWQVNKIVKKNELKPESLVLAKKKYKK